MKNKFKLPSKGFVFWPVGTGDSTTLMVNEKTAIQIDLRHTEKSEDNESTEWSIIDHLAELLPKRNGKPYLAVFTLTHPDLDHIQGFKELNRRVQIGDLWYTPRVLRDYDENEELCDDAVAFRNEADRRRKAVLKNPDNIGFGDRIKVIGHDDILNEKKYADLPDNCKERPGTTIKLINGEDISEECVMFIHAPFSDDQAKERNNTSLALHVMLKEGEEKLEALLLGDREYPSISQIFRVTEEHGNEEFLGWDILLAPHHCSKKVMFFQNPEDEEPSFKKDIMDDFEKYAKDAAYVVASAHSDFSNEEGKNPPHQKAREKYEEIVDSGHFLCTHEHPSEKEPEPIVFKLSDSGITHPETGKGTAAASLADAIDAARGESSPPSQHIGFGRSHR